ncbi:gp58 [Bacillus phage G]|uniref:Gp58 n=1 Tax=Bacillus phage G TaxID=2884420 RepID=G3MBC8_9CAUD|nr:gp58 [Bacillus phage G]AEO93329.1 gp58 [Bacillus phage G]
MTKELTHKDICPYFEDNCSSVGCVCPKYLAYQDVNNPEIVAREIKKMGIDPNSDKLTLMMEMQKSFAAKFHKIDGFEKTEVDYWIKAYDTCVTDEIAEVHEFLEVLPDMQAKDNLLELQKEFIDIWHFLMDMFIVANMNADDLIKVYSKNHKDVEGYSKPLEAMFENEKQYLISKINNFDSLSKEENDLEILKYSSMVMQGTRKVRQQISWKHWKKPSNEINYEFLHAALVDTFRSLVQCFVLAGLDAEKLTNIYKNKNIENVLRQLHGY